MHGLQLERDDLHREVKRALSSRIVQSLMYDPAGRIERQSIERDKAPAALSMRRYRYDAAGQLMQIENSRKGTTDYRYDLAERLIEAIDTCFKEGVRMTDNIRQQASMLGELEPAEWSNALVSVLASPKVIEIEGYPHSERVSFVLERARMRKENSEQLGLQTFGLESLIATLESLSSERRLKSYAVKNDQYTGSCFVCDGKHHRMRIRGPRSRTNNAISRLGV
nr:RHS repeat domain-containing protein [Burkholderia gladioli]